MIRLSIVGVYTEKPRISGAFFCPFTFFIYVLPLPKIIFIGSFANRQIDKLTMEPKYKVNPLTGELQEYVFEYNGILALRNFTARVEDERLILHAADDVNFSILEALVSEVEINGVVYNNPTAAQEALTRLTFNQNRPVLLDKSLKELILGAVQKVEGKGLSSNDYTNDEKQKNEENALKRVANVTVTGDVNKIITITFADSTVIQAPFKDNDHIPSADVNMNSLNFNFNTGVLTGVKNDGNEITVTLDGRYALISHNHDEQYAAKEHTHSEYAPTNHTHNWNDIQGKPDNLATTDNVKTAIEGIQIGGKNLLRETKEFIVNGQPNYMDFSWNRNAGEPISERFNGNVVRKINGDWQGVKANMPDIIGEPVTISFWAKTNGAGKFGNYANKNKNPNGIEQFSKYSNDGVFINDNQWHRYTIFNPKGMCLGEGSSNGFIEFYNVTGEIFYSSIKIERGSVATDWSPAPEDLDFYKNVINSSELNSFVLRETGVYTVAFGGGQGLYLNFKGAGSASSLEFFKSDWYPYTRIGVRNSVDSTRFNDDGGAFRDLAWYADVYRAGAAIGSNWTAVVEHQNNTIFVENSLSIELNQLQNMGSVSFIKTFDTGAVTFTCTGKNIIYPFDNTFNGSKGSTAVVSIYDNDCYIRISNV